MSRMPITDPFEDFGDVAEIARGLDDADPAVRRVAVLALAGGSAFVFLAPRHPVTHETVNDSEEAPAATQPAGASRGQGE